jgi:hypothetical protein
MTIYQPYTYLIGWTKHNKWYYGCQYANGQRVANPSNLWTTYFTSSKHVKECRELYGEPDVVQVRCVHRDSGAIGESDLTRSQHDNKRLAFRKMAETKQFRTWHKIETAKRMGNLISIEDNVQRAMKETNMKVEGRVDGKWVPIEEAPFIELD